MPRRHSLPRRLTTGAALRLLLRPLLLAGAVCASLAAQAVDRDDERYARLPEAVRRVESETGGKVLQVRPIQRGDREIYRMKVLTPDGRVKIMQDDPKRRRDKDRDEDDADKTDDEQE